MKSKQKYLNVDKGYRWIVRVNICDKNFIVWRGNDENLGIKIAKKVEELMLQSKAVFMDWFDYEKDKYLEEVINDYNS